MKKISLVTVQGKKQMCVAELIVLTNSQYEKLTDDCFAGRVDAIAKDCHIDWSIDETQNAHVINITRTTTNVVDDAFYHDLEISAANFMSAIDKLEYDKKEPECPSHESNDDLEFVLIIDSSTHPFCPELTGWGKMSYNLLKEMCELYLAKHDKS